MFFSWNSTPKYNITKKFFFNFIIMQDLFLKYVKDGVEKKMSTLTSCILDIRSSFILPNYSGKQTFWAIMSLINIAFNVLSPYISYKSAL